MSDTEQRPARSDELDGEISPGRLQGCPIAFLHGARTDRGLAARARASAVRALSSHAVGATAGNGLHDFRPSHQCRDHRSVRGRDLRVHDPHIRPRSSDSSDCHGDCQSISGGRHPHPYVAERRLQRHIPAEWSLATNQNQQAVWLGDNTISGLWVTSADAPHEAHGSYHIATFVINKTTAQPVMLADVFGDFGAALQRLSQNAATQLSAKLGDTFRPAGVAPTAENFTNWIPTSDGIELRFDDDQVGPHGLPVITVPGPSSTASP